jgi:hypothetical protein
MEELPSESLYATERGEPRETAGFVAPDDFVVANLDPGVSRELVAIPRHSEAESARDTTPP